MLPFTFSAEAFSRCSRVLERSVMCYEAIAAVATLAELYRGEVVAALGKFGHRLDVAYLWVECPCRDGVGRIVGHRLGEAEAALE